MISFPCRLLMTVALIHALSACTSSTETEPVALTKELAPTSAADPGSELPDLVETSVPDLVETNIKADIEPVRRQVDERFLRPVLPIDGDGSGEFPDILPNGAAVSFVVMDLERGTPIVAHHADRDHIPASSAKLATAVVALDLLGPDHRFRTELLAAGPIEDGVLKGDLILKGGGDPLLDIPDLLPLIDELSRLPVRSIEGQFLIDDSSLPRFTEIEPTQPTEAAYNPGLGALSIAFNRVNVRWTKRPGLAVETVPSLAEASFEDAKADRLPPGGVQLRGINDGKAIWQLADKGRRRSKRSLPVKDPGLYAGQVFADLAILYGIDLPPPVRGVRPAGSRLLAVHESRPLREQVRDMLWYSNNLVAELIGLSAAKTLEPELSSLEASSDIILSELKRHLPELPWDEARLHNHSGLSSEARLSPEQLAGVLRHGWQNGMLSSLLPGSGWSGTLARRFAGPEQALRIWAKTGSINYVTTLGGYLFSPSYAPAAFVIMISDEKARAAYDAKERRTRKIEKRARAWRDDAEEAMNQIVERWLEPPTLFPEDSLHALSLVGDETSR